MVHWQLLLLLVGSTTRRMHWKGAFVVKFIFVWPLIKYLVIVNNSSILPLTPLYSSAPAQQQLELKTSRRSTSFDVDWQQIKRRAIRTQSDGRWVLFERHHRNPRLVVSCFAVLASIRLYLEDEE